jgi:hypothetical protein
MTTYQMIELTSSTDQFGQIEATFANNIDKITATINSVGSGSGNHGGAHSLKSWVNGNKAAAARIETSAGPVANTQVTVTFLAGNG